MAPSSCFVQLHSHLAGHCPNNSSLNPPLAAVVVVAPKGGADKNFHPLQHSAPLIRIPLELRLKFDLKNVKKLRYHPDFTKDSQDLLKNLRASLASPRTGCIIGISPLIRSEKKEQPRNAWENTETVGRNGKIQRQKTVHRSGCSHHGHHAGPCVRAEYADQPAAKREHTVPDGGHGLSRCQPGACGERGLRRDGECAGHHLGREKRHRHLGRKLQSAADGV